MKKIEVFNLGTVDYRQCWEWQKILLEKRKANLIPDTLLLVRHPHTYTIGKGGKQEHLLADPRLLAEIKAQFVPVDRGGDITYHGPGQWVLYPIIQLKEHGLDVNAYLRALEEVGIQTLQEYGLCAERVEGMTGIWVQGAKIAAIGVRLSRWVSMHGMAINLNCDLNYFKYIVPCGIAAKPVTSLKKVLKETVDETLFEKRLLKHFETVFSVTALPKKTNAFPLQSTVPAKEAI